MARCGRLGAKRVVPAAAAASPSSARRSGGGCANTLASHRRRVLTGADEPRARLEDLTYRCRGHAPPAATSGRAEVADSRAGARLDQQRRRPSTAPARGRCAPATSRRRWSRGSGASIDQATAIVALGEEVHARRAAAGRGATTRDAVEVGRWLVALSSRPRRSRAPARPTVGVAVPQRTPVDDDGAPCHWPHRGRPWDRLRHTVRKRDDR